MWLMDDVTICDIRARNIRIWQINSQNFRVRKIWNNWFLDMGVFSWQNATYTIQFIFMICINSEKLVLPGRCAPVEFFSWKCGKLRKTAKSCYPALIWPFRTSLFSALSWNKISHMKLHIKIFKKTKDMFYKIFKTTKDMFYKQFEFFANWQGADYGASWTLSFEPKLPVWHLSVFLYVCVVAKRGGGGGWELENIIACSERASIALALADMTEIFHGSFVEGDNICPKILVRHYGL